MTAEAAPPVRTDPSLRIAWAVAALAAAAFCLHASDAWNALPDYSHGVFLPMFCAYAVWTSWESFARSPARPWPAGLALLLIGGVLFTAGWYLRLPFGARPVLLWLLYGGLSAGVVGLLLAHHGWPRIRIALFPFFLMLFAIPVPGRIMAPVHSVLQGLGTAVSVKVFELWGWEVQRYGFVIVMPNSAPLMVGEACSGIRSLTALLAIAAMVAYGRGLSVVQGALLLAASVPLVLLANILRIVATGFLSVYAGREAAEGTAHTVLGLMVFVVGTILILVVAFRFRPPGEAAGEGGSADADKPAEPVSNTPPPAFVGWTAAAAAVVFAALCLWFETFRAPAVEAAGLADNVPVAALGRWKGEDMPVGKLQQAAYEMLGFDETLMRRYTDPAGNKVQLFVGFWSSAKSFSDPHNLDVCWSANGWTLVAAGHRTMQPPGTDLAVEVATRHMTAPGFPDRHFLYYAHQGRMVWDPARPSLLGDHALGLLKNPTNSSAKLLILMEVIEKAPSEPDHATVVDRFAADFLPKLYETCPWADPR
jgi:EpsI family protein